MVQPETVRNGLLAVIAVILIVAALQRDFDVAQRELRRVLGESAQHPVLTGAGGCGKSRFALHLAAELEPPPHPFEARERRRGPCGALEDGRRECLIAMATPRELPPIARALRSSRAPITVRLAGFQTRATKIARTRVTQ